jgi:predicted alpha/beta-fold hydrolase
MRLRTILEWDDHIVAPRFGFPSREHYYEEASAGPRLREVDLPTLFVAAEADPMVTADQLRPWLEEASPAVEVAWTGRGGHVGFPDDLDLGFGDVGHLDPQLVRWLLRHR